MRRPILIISAFCCTASLICAQNLVPNGNFESYIECPRSFVYGGYSFKCANWFLPTQATSDYYNRCDTRGLLASVPCTWNGYNETHGGNGMVGLYAEVKTTMYPAYKEYISARLKQPLVAGQCYYFEMYAKMSAYSYRSTHHIGVYFSNTRVLDTTLIFTLPYQPQITSPKGLYFINSDQWQIVSGIYNAKGGEEYLVIGSFDSIVPVVYRKPGIKLPCVESMDTGNVSTAYIFVDDVLLTDHIPGITRTHTIQLNCGDVKHIDVEQNQPDLSYKWNNGSTLPYIDIASEGKYWVETSWSCGHTTDTFLVSRSPILFSAGLDTILCPGAITLPLFATPLDGFSYVWSTGSNQSSAMATATGTYWVKAQKAGCILYDEITLGQRTPFKPHLGNDTSVCPGNAVWLDASLSADSGKSITYTWLMNGTPLAAITPSLQVDESATYIVIKTIDGCKASDTLLLQNIPVPFSPMMKDTFICDSNSIIVNAGNAGFTKLWSTGETTDEIRVSAPGLYWVNMGNNISCMVSDSFTVDQHSLPSDFLQPDTFFCSGDAVTIQGKAGYNSYQWSTGSTQQSVSINAAGSYMLRVHDGFCTNAETIAVREQPLPHEIVLEENAICEKENQRLSIALQPQYAYVVNNTLWPHDSLSFDKSGTYELSITDSLGCVMLQPLTIEEFCPPAVFAPNAFTPGSDRLNDQFAPVVSYPHRIVSYSLEIYNRWGQQIFTSNAYEKGWNGTYQSFPAPADTYVYIIQVVWNGHGKDIHKQLKGNVTLLK